MQVCYVQIALFFFLHPTSARANSISISSPSMQIVARVHSVLSSLQCVCAIAHFRWIKFNHFRLTHLRFVFTVFFHRRRRRHQITLKRLSFSCFFFSLFIACVTIDTNYCRCDYRTLRKYFDETIAHASMRVFSLSLPLTRFSIPFCLLCAYVVWSFISL